jgi:hypothetical protein
MAQHVPFMQTPAIVQYPQFSIMTVLDIDPLKGLKASLYCHTQLPTTAYVNHVAVIQLSLQSSTCVSGAAQQ